MRPVSLARSWSAEGLDRPRGVGDVGEQPGQRVPRRQRVAAPFLGRQYVVDEGAAIQNALLLASERVKLRERCRRDS